MQKNSKKRGSNRDFDRIIVKENNAIDKLKQAVSYFQKKYNLLPDEVIRLLKAQIEIPVSVFCKELTAFEAIVKFLKEQKFLSYHDIAVLLTRDERNIWHTYNNAIKKRKSPFKIKSSEFLIPVSIFQTSKLSILATIVVYLKEKFSYHEIAVLLKRDDRTIWTVYNRIKK